LLSKRPGALAGFLEKPFEDVDLFRVCIRKNSSDFRGVLAENQTITSLPFFL